MGNDLKTLIRLGKWTVDEKRRVLATLYDTEEKTQTHIRDLDARLAAEQAVVKANAAIAITYPAFYMHHRGRKELALKILAGIRQQIEAMRDELADAYRELKTYETAQANRLRQEAEARNYAEQKQLDEIGANLHRRKGEV